MSPSADVPLPLRVTRWIDRHALLPPRAAVLLAVSGGADSVAMLHVLADLAEQPERRWRLHVAHLDHALREDSAEDAAFVAGLADELGIPCTCQRRSVERGPDESLESAARRVRYAFLESAAAEAGCRWVATAHHADDHVETVLHRILRGTAIEGLRGIRPRRALYAGDLHLVRPMLDATREEILVFLRQRELPWRDDPTNATTEPTRNRIRHELLPLLRERFNPQIDQAILRLATAAEWAGQWMDGQAAELLETLTIDASSRHVTLSAPGLRRRGAWPASLAIRAAIERLGAPMRNLGLDHVQRVLALLEADASDRRLDLPDDVRVRREAEKLVIELSAEHPPAPAAQEHAIRVPGATPLPDGAGIDVDVREVAFEGTCPAHAGEALAILKEFLQGKTDHEELVDLDRLALPLVARRWRHGDRFYPLGAEGHRKLSDFFVDRKVPAERRRRTWVVCDQLGPIWVAPFRIDHRVRVTPETRRFARIRMRPAAGEPAA